ncbi:MAG: hypothetical protein ACHP7D_10630 [Lysobacterales bacterium]
MALQARLARIRDRFAERIVEMYAAPIVSDRCPDCLPRATADSERVETGA